MIRNIINIFIKQKSTLRFKVKSTYYEKESYNLLLDYIVKRTPEASETYETVKAAIHDAPKLHFLESIVYPQSNDGRVELRHWRVFISSIKWILYCVRIVYDRNPYICF